MQKGKYVDDRSIDRTTDHKKCAALRTWILGIKSGGRGSYNGYDELPIMKSIIYELSGVKQIKSKSISFNIIPIESITHTPADVQHLSVSRVKCADVKPNDVCSNVCGSLSPVWTNFIQYTRWLPGKFSVIFQNLKNLWGEYIWRACLPWKPMSGWNFSVYLLRILHVENEIEVFFIIILKPVKRFSQICMCRNQE